MAIIFVDSCSHYTTAQLAFKYAVTDPNNKITVDPVGGDRGNGAIVIASNTSNAFLARATGSLVVTVGFRFKVSQLPTSTSDRIVLCGADYTSYFNAVFINENGFLAIVKTNGTTVTSGLQIIANAWYYLELYTNWNDSVPIVNVNNAQILMSNANNQYANTFYLGNFGSVNHTIVSTQQATVSYTDIIVSTDVMPGSKHITRGILNADGTVSQFTASNGSANKYSVVDEAVADTSDFLYSATNGNKQLFPTNFTKNPTAISAVVLTSLANMSEAGTALPFAHIMKNGALETEGATKTLLINPSNSFQQTVFATDTAGVAWTKANVNSTEFGFKVV